MIGAQIGQSALELREQVTQFAEPAVTLQVKIGVADLGAGLNVRYLLAHICGSFR